MASLERVVVEWTAGTALPGISVFYGNPSVPTLANEVYTFFDSIKALIPSSLSLTIPSSGDIIDDADGALAGSWSTTGVGSLAMTGGGSYAAGVGCRVVWRTNGVRNRRRVRGSTFLCPLITNVYEANGTLTSSALSTISTAAGVLASSGTLAVWSRPTTVGAADGDSNTVLSALVPDRVTALRSRRY